MTQQSDFRMPATGEGWRHYNNGTLYTIIGIATDDNGIPTVVYTPYRWGLAQLPPIYTRPLDRFLQTIDDNKVFRPRFKFERESGDAPECAYIRGTPPPAPKPAEPATKTYTRDQAIQIARIAFLAGYWAGSSKPRYILFDAGRDAEDALNNWLLTTDVFDRSTI